MGTINLDEIQHRFEKVLSYSQAYPFEINSKEIIQKWYQEKNLFIKKFNGTIWKSKNPIVVNLSEEQKRKMFNEFLSDMNDANLLNYTKGDITFETFLNDNYRGFFHNRVIKDYPSLNIKEGMKLLKSFKLFLPDMSCIRFAQDIASQYLQEEKIEGYLYLSVDPIDFLTISENNTKWSSCQALYGSYRSGNLNYMVDDTTIIAYIADEKQEQLKCMPKGLLWNNKKWRMLIHINKKSIIYNKPYPFEHHLLLEEVYNSIKNLSFYKAKFTSPMKIGFKYVEMEPHHFIEFDFIQLTLEGRIYDSRDIFDFSEYNGFLDLVSSSSYTPYASINYELYNDYFISRNGLDISINGINKEKEYKAFKNIFGTKIGKKYPCPCCGIGFPKEFSSFLCDKCLNDKRVEGDFFPQCYDCGCRIYEDDESFTLDNGSIYCKKCYKSNINEEN